MNSLKLIFNTLLAIVFFSSCGIYRQNILFQVDEDETYDSLNVAVEEINGNYKIDIDDQISIQVYTANGELLIDPDNKLAETNSVNSRTTIEPPKYLVATDGKVNLPLIGLVSLEGLTLRQSDSLLAEKYNEFYKETFVLTKLENRRVIVLGVDGGSVIPLENENMNLIEVLALAGGVTENGKAQKIRVIRGDLNKPQVQVVDLSTIDGMAKANLKVESHDIIYVEPVKIVFRETLRDVTPIVSLATSIITIIILITR